METRRKVLLVEDEPIVQRVHKAFLEKMGFTVDVLATGKQTLASYQNGYHLIVLDGGLPDISGFEVGKRVREEDRRLCLPRKILILLSGYPYDQVKDGCLLADIDDFAIKPISYSELEIITQRWLPL